MYPLRVSHFFFEFVFRTHITPLAYYVSRGGMVRRGGEWGNTLRSRYQRRVRCALSLLLLLSTWVPVHVRGVPLYCIRIFPGSQVQYQYDGAHTYGSRSS